MDRYNLVSLGGIVVLLGLAWLCSAHRRRMNWRAIGWGVALQLAFALFVFRIPAGTKVFLFLNEIVVRIVSASAAGSQFLFGRLALPPGAHNAQGEPSLGFFLAFQAFPTIVFFSALISILYFFRLLPVLIKAFASLFTRLMRISGAESLCAASNIFVGVESTLAVRPHLGKMTASELCTVLTAGMATVASNVLALYVFCLHDVFPNIAGHLISASILSAPAALVMSKIIIPETDTPETLGIAIEPHYEKEATLFEAVINGANSGLKLIFGICALLIAVLGLVAVMDMVLVGVGWRVNALAGWQVDWSLKGLLGYCFYPITIVLGVPPSDAVAIAKVIGERTVATEVPGYLDLAALLRSGALQYPARSATIATYALCGFAHVASLSIFVGGVHALAPQQASRLSRVALRALLSATLACLLTGAVAGVFATESSLLLGVR
jgi:CNT family concentrative nucleoside transporter